MKFNPIVSQFLNLRRLFVIAIATLTLVTVQFFGVMSVVNAGPLTPEANSYDTPQTNARVKYDRSLDNLTTKTGKQTGDRDDLVQNSRNNLKSTADNVREKLNLDEPIAPSTKEFARDVKNRANRAIDKTQDALKGNSKSISGATSGGYYSRRDRIRNAY